MWWDNQFHSSILVELCQLYFSNIIQWFLIAVSTVQLPLYKYFLKRCSFLSEFCWWWKYAHTFYLLAKQLCFLAREDEIISIYYHEIETFLKQDLLEFIIRYYTIVKWARTFAQKFKICGSSEAIDVWGVVPVFCED